MMMVNNEEDNGGIGGELSFGFQFELKMQEVLELQIAAEEEGVSLLEQFSKGSDNWDLASTHNRKLKGKQEYNLSNKMKDVGNVNIDDYHPVDPVPSSKAMHTNGLIEHGSPLMPYIPKPETPPKRNGP